MYCSDMLDPPVAASSKASVASEATCIDIKSANKGINFEGFNISSMLYADDVVVFAEPPQDLQQMLDCWCQKWGININPKKTKAMHFRHKRRPITRHTPGFHTGGGQGGLLPPLGSDLPPLGFGLPFPQMCL